MVFVEALTSIIMIVAVRNMSGIRFKKLSHYLWIVGIYFCELLAAIFSETLGIIIVFVLMIFMTRHVSENIKGIASLVYCFISGIIAIIGDTLTYVLITRFFDNGVEYIENVHTHTKFYLLYFFSVFLFSYIISRLIGIAIHKKFPKWRNFLTTRKLVLFFLCLILIFLFTYATAFFVDNEDVVLIAMIYIVFVVLLLVILYSIVVAEINSYNLENSKREMEQLLKYTNSIEAMYNNMRSLRHDYKNVLLTMRGYMDDEDMPGLEKYFSEKIVPFTNDIKGSVEKIQSLIYVKQPEIKGLIAVKAIYAQENGVDVLVDIKDDIYIDKISMIDMSRMLGILMDNAYEACIETNEPYMHIGIINNPKYIIIIVVNNTVNKDIDINMLYEDGYSSKGKGRGLGLNNLMNIIDSYNGVTIETVVDYPEVKQIINIYKGES